MACRWSSEGRGQKLNEIRTGHYSGGVSSAEEVERHRQYWFACRGGGAVQERNRTELAESSGPASHQVTHRD